MKLNKIKEKVKSCFVIRRNASVFIALAFLCTMYLNWLSIRASKYSQWKKIGGYRRAEGLHRTNERENSDETPGRVNIMVNAYMRSGSYFISRLLMGLPGTFSYMEPLWRLSVFGYFNADNQLCDTRWPYCRQLGKSVAEFKGIQDEIRSTLSSDLPIQTAYRILHSIYSCQLEKIKTIIDKQILPYPSNIAKVWFRYIHCNATKLPCLSYAIQNCTGSNIRITKVVRASLAATRHLLETDKTLRVLQLVRDPRGIICSRLLKTDWYPLKLLQGNYTPIVQNTRALCKRMTEDYNEGKQLMAEFPNRVKFIRYDDFMDKSRQSVWDNMSAFLGVQKIILSKKNKVKPFDWRELLDRTVLGIVDRECSLVYQALGYTPLRHEELRNGSLLSFIPQYDVT